MRDIAEELLLIGLVIVLFFIVLPYFVKSALNGLDPLGFLRKLFDPTVRWWEGTQHAAPGSPPGSELSGFDDGQAGDGFGGGGGYAF